jgi:hypothetical protein
LQTRHEVTRIRLIKNGFVLHRIVQRSPGLRPKTPPRNVDPAFAFAIQKRPFLGVQDRQVLHGANGNEQVARCAAGQQRQRNVVSGGRQMSRFASQFLVAIAGDFHASLLDPELSLV